MIELKQSPPKLIEEAGKRVALALIRLRRELGLSLDEFSKLTGLSKSTLQNYESGKNTPNFPSLLAIALATKSSIDRLCDLATLMSSLYPPDQVAD